MKIEELIKQCVFFSDPGAAALAELVRIVEPKSCGKSKILFSEGDEAKALFILASGAIDLIRSSPSGKEQLVRNVKPGEMFAEAAMFSGEFYPATAVARAKSELLAIRKERFVSFVRAHPDALLAIMGAMAKLLRHLNALLADLTLGQVSSRLAAFLLAKSRERRKATFSLGITKRELALRLGTVPETLSRNLRKLKDDGIIDVKGDFVTIRKTKALEFLAGR